MKRGISEAITSVILITIILVISISTLSYISSAISISQASSEVAQMKDLFRTLADQINKLYGTPNSTYRVTTTISKGSLGLTDPYSITLNIVSTNTVSLPYSSYNFAYWISKNLYFEQSQLIYGSLLYKQGSFQIVNSSIYQIPIIVVITNSSTSSWFIKMFPIIMISNYLINNVMVYNIDIVTFKLGTVQKIIGPLTISFTVSQSVRTFSNVTNISINSTPLNFSNPNIVIIRNSVIVFNFT